MEIQFVKLTSVSILITFIQLQVKPGTKEYNFAKAALFERHPDMAHYPAGNS